jgi:hypothetical protein
MLNSDFELQEAFHVLFVCVCVCPKLVNQTPRLAHILRSEVGSSVGGVQLFTAAVGAHYVISLTDAL